MTGAGQRNWRSPPRWRWSLRAPPEEHPWALRLTQRSVARALGVDPAEFQRQQGQGALAGLWTPGSEAAAAPTVPGVPGMPGHEARPSGLIIPRS